MICPSTRSASTARTEEVMRPWRTTVHQHRPRPRRGVATAHRRTGIGDWIIQGVKGEFTRASRTMQRFGMSTREIAKVTGTASAVVYTMPQVGHIGFIRLVVVSREPNRG